MTRSRCLFDLEAKENERHTLEQETLRADFWDDATAAQATMAKLNGVKDEIEPLESFAEKLEDAFLTLELIEEEPDEGLEEELSGSVETLEKDYDKLFLATLLSGEYDKNDAILSIHAGAGGTEAQDWAAMLARMYARYVERSGFTLEELDENRDVEAGLKSITYLVHGKNAYGYLKTEKGVHRLVRISPFDSAKRRHTSFASVDVTPDLPDDVEIEINPEDLRIDTYRSSGKGGQHVNKTDSAVRITHIPTGVVVQCQNERSQFQNKDRAMKMLYAKLLQIREEEKRETIEDIQGQYSQIAWGSQIRSYVFHPYTLVKDHRTGYEVGNVQAVMDGEIQGFIDASLRKQLGDS